MTAAGYKIWWKKYLTTLQITQFVVDLFVVYFASYSYATAEYLPGWPTYGSCSGTEGAAIFGCVLLTSYLFLFIAFYKVGRSGAPSRLAALTYRLAQKTYNTQAAAKAAAGRKPVTSLKKKN